MTDPRQIAASIVGAVEWQTEVFGFCRCPGEALHTHKTGKKDCRVSVDGAPTIYCFHASCAPAVAEANKRLRRELNASPWVLALPGGKVLRSGDVLQSSGTVLPREVVQARAKAEGRDAGEQLVLETLTVTAERFKPELFDTFRWPFAQIVEDSPLLVAERTLAWAARFRRLSSDYERLTATFASYNWFAQATILPKTVFAKTA